MECLAILRKDLKERGLYPPSVPEIHWHIWETCEFRILDDPEDDWEDEDGFNMLIEHPFTREQIRVNTIDFDYEWRMKNE